MEFCFFKAVDFLLKMRGSFFLCLEIMRSDVVRPRVSPALNIIAPFTYVCSDSSHRIRRKAVEFRKNNDSISEWKIGW